MSKASFKTEEIVEFFVSKDFEVLKSPERCRRLNKGGMRWYLKEVGDEIKHYLSLTTFTKLVMPDSHFLQSWKLDVAALKGVEGMNDYVQDTADFGTLLHILIAESVKSGRYSYELLQKVISEYGVKEEYMDMWERDLVRGILSFNQWMIDFNVDIKAIEYPISTERGIMTLIDLVAQLDVIEKGFYGEVYLSGAQKGMPKETKKSRRVNAIIDIKSGMKGFYESHEMQLALCYEMWNDKNRGIFEVEKIFNWSPNDWVSNPGYNFKDQTKNKYMGVCEEFGVRNTDVFFAIGRIQRIFDFKDSTMDLEKVEINIGEKSELPFMSFKSKVFDKDVSVAVDDFDNDFNLDLDEEIK